MNEITHAQSGKLTRFAPDAVRANQIKRNAVIDVAARMHDWPLLEDAVDAKVAEQAEFVTWWDNNVGVRQSPGGKDGGASNADLRSTVSKQSAEAQTGIAQQQVSRWRQSLANPDQYRERVMQAAYRKAGLEPNETHRVNTGEYEWYTPVRFINAAREVMGDIDLDPATHPIAQETIKAKQCFTAANDGLTKQWHGRVWLNPPYAQPLMANFVAKLCTEFAAGRTIQAVMLTHNYTDTAWFHDAQAAAVLLCFTRGRIAFIGADGPPTQGQAFFYFGREDNAFRRVFSAFGFIR